MKQFTAEEKDKFLGKVKESRCGTFPGLPIHSDNEKEIALANWLVRDGYLELYNGESGRPMYKFTNAGDSFLYQGGYAGDAQRERRGKRTTIIWTAAITAIITTAISSTVNWLLS